MIKNVAAPRDQNKRRKPRGHRSHAVEDCEWPWRNVLPPFSSQEEFVICKTMKAILTDLVETMKDVRSDESEGASAAVRNIYFGPRTTFVELV